MNLSQSKGVLLRMQVASAEMAESSFGKSWLGSLADEQGGAGVWFDFPHDDITAVDVRQLKRVVVMAIELLCHQQKWEKLVDIGLRFEAVTRYTQFINCNAQFYSSF